MPSTPKRFGGPAGLNTGTATIFTVPVGHKYLVRDIALVNQSLVAAADCGLYLGAVGLANLLYKAPAIPIGTSVHPVVWWEFNAGEALVANRVGASNITFTAWGYDLT